MRSLPPTRIFSRAGGSTGAASGLPGRERERENSLLTTNLSGSTSSCLRCFWWTGLAPWEFEFPFPCSLVSTFLGRERAGSTQGARCQAQEVLNPRPLNLERFGFTHLAMFQPTRCRAAKKMARYSTQRKIRNPNPKSTTQNSKPKTRNPKPNTEHPNRPPYESLSFRRGLCDAPTSPQSRIKSPCSLPLLSLGRLI